MHVTGGSQSSSKIYVGPWHPPGGARLAAELGYVVNAPFTSWLKEMGKLGWWQRGHSLWLSRGVQMVKSGKETRKQGVFPWWVVIIVNCQCL